MSLDTIMLIAFIAQCLCFLSIFEKMCQFIRQSDRSVMDATLLFSFVSKEEQARVLAELIAFNESKKGRQ